MTWLRLDKELGRDYNIILNVPRKAIYTSLCDNVSTNRSGECILLPWVSLQQNTLLDCDGLGQVAREIDIETFRHGQPVGHQLKGNNVEQTLQNVACLRHLDTLSLVWRELGVAGVADDNGSASTGNDCSIC